MNRSRFNWRIRRRKATTRISPSLRSFTFTILVVSCVVFTPSILSSAVFVEQYSPTPSTLRNIEAAPFDAPSDIEIESLNAQRSSSFAAWSSFWLGVFQAALGTIGAVVVYRTLIETRRAALAADRSASHAISSSEQQLRAYVNVDEAQVKLIGDVAEIRIVYRNGGQTPAHNLRIWANVKLFWCENPAEDDFDEMAAHPGVAVIGGQSPPLLLSLTVTGLIGEGTNQHGKDARMYVYGNMRYIDVFGNERSTMFRYMRSPIGTGNMIASRGGNAAT